MTPTGLCAGVQPIVAIEPEVEGFSMCAADSSDFSASDPLGDSSNESDRSEMNAETMVDELNATIVAAMRDAPAARGLVEVGKDQPYPRRRICVATLRKSKIAGYPHGSRHHGGMTRPPPEKPSAVSEESQR